MVLVLFVLLLLHCVVQGIVLQKDLSADYKENVDTCTTPGCYNGYCWAYCGSKNRPRDWCYTTKGVRHDKGYITCSKESDCDGCWNCATSCYPLANPVTTKKPAIKSVFVPRKKPTAFKDPNVLSDDQYPDGWGK